MQTITNSIIRIEIQSLVSWDLYFKRLTSNGDFKVEPPGHIPNYIDLDELTEQCKLRNAMFVGTDGCGNHARIKICDDEVRRALLGDESDNAILLTFDAVKELLAIKDRVKFEARLKQLVLTDAEKRMIIELATKAGIDEAPSWMRDMIEAVAGNQVKVFVP